MLKLNWTCCRILRVVVVHVVLLSFMTLPVESSFITTSSTSITTTATTKRSNIYPPRGVLKISHPLFYPTGTTNKSALKSSSTVKNDGYHDKDNSNHNDDKNDIYQSSVEVLSLRRQTMFRTALTTTIALLSTTSSSLAATKEVLAPPPGSTPENPVVILGGGGKTGKEVALALTREGLYSVTMTRTGKAPILPNKISKQETGGTTNDPSVFVTHYPNPVNVCDSVDNLARIMNEIHPSAIVYCASASKQGGTAFQVDADGVANIAKAVQNLDNVKFVLVSALAVSRPESKSYKMTNNLGGNYDQIMDAKRSGEDQLRAIRRNTKNSNNYVIIRPGPLLGVKSKNGPLDIELNQGDTIGGGISRDELAGVVVGAIVNPHTTYQGSTVEAYRTSTRTKLQPEFNAQSGNEITGSATYAGLFDNVKSDSQLLL